MKFEWGNVSQIVSAISALALCLLALYGVFFSTTSQTLVAYLQSELAVRNQRIATLELREQQLQTNIATSESALNSLTNEKIQAEKRVSDLNAQADALRQKTQELSANLSNTTFSLVREKIAVGLADGLSALAVLRIKIQSEWLGNGVTAQTVRPWDFYLKSVQANVAALPDSDRRVGKAVLDKFVEQCSQFNSKAVQVPAMRVASNSDFSAYGNDRDKHPLAIRSEAIAKQLEKIEQDMQACFMELKQ